MPISNELAIFLAERLIFISVLAVPYLWIKREQHDLIRIVVSVVVAFSISEILKTFTAVPRPFVVGEFEPLVSVSARDFYGSFPSGHTAFLAALGAAILFTEKIPGILVLLLAALVGWGRVLVGVHYPLDIVGGFGLGVTVSSIFKYIHDRYPVW